MIREGEFVLEDFNFILNVLWILEYLIETQDTGLEIFTTSGFNTWGEKCAIWTKKGGNKITNYRYRDSAILSWVPIRNHSSWTWSCDFPVHGHSRQGDDSCRGVHPAHTSSKNWNPASPLVPWENRQWQFPSKYILEEGNQFPSFESARYNPITLYLARWGY